MLPEGEAPSAKKSVLKRQLLVERRSKAFEMRKSGASAAQIARALNISRATAQLDINRVISEMQKSTMETAAKVRVLELARLDQMFLSVWKSALDTNLEADIRLAFFDRALKIIERRCKMYGLDAHEMQRGEDLIGSILSETARQAILNSEEGRKTALVLIERIAVARAGGSDHRQSGGAGVDRVERIVDAGEASGGPESKAR